MGIKKRYRAIDGLRAFAAIGVALMHIKANGSYDLPGFIGNELIGSMGEFVYLFMMISGFSMCCGYYNRIISNEIAVGEFYGKRYRKIWPYFAALCLLDFAISPSLESLYETFADLTLCFGLLPNANISVIGVGWFIGVVFCFYLIFPFICWLLQTKLRAWMSFAVALIFNVLCQIYFFNSDHMPVSFDYRSNFLYCSVYFLGGGIIFLYREKISEFCGKHRMAISISCLLSAALYFYLGNSTLTLLLMFSLFLIYAIGDYDKARILDNKITHFLSGISMEVYLCHMLMFRIIEKINLTHAFGTDLLSYIFTSTVALIMAIVFSVVAKRILEKIEMKIKRKV